MTEEFAFENRVLAVLERLDITSGARIYCEGDLPAFFENLHYYGVRLAKLQVDTRAVARSLELSQELCQPYLDSLDKEGRADAHAALEILSSQMFVAVSGAYFDTQRKESAALLAVLDAELSAENLESLLRRVLEITTPTFTATLGMVLLRDLEGDVLRAKAWVGFDVPTG